MTNNNLTVNSPRTKTLVCVTDQFNCDRIIKSGGILAELTASDLSVLNIASPEKFQDPQSIEYLFKVTANHGGKMTVLYHNQPSKAIVQYIKANKDIANVITGMPEGDNSVLHKLWSRFTHLHFFTVTASGHIDEVGNPARAAHELTQNHTVAVNFL